MLGQTNKDSGAQNADNHRLHFSQILPKLSHLASLRLCVMLSTNLHALRPRNTQLPRPPYRQEKGSFSLNLMRWQQW